MTYSKLVFAEMVTELVVARAFTDRCVQLHGGYGYTSEYPVGRLGRQPRAVDLRRHHRDHEGIIGRGLGL